MLEKLSGKNKKVKIKIKGNVVLIPNKVISYQYFFDNCVDDDFCKSPIGNNAFANCS